MHITFMVNMCNASLCYALPLLTHSRNTLTRIYLPMHHFVLIAVLTACHMRLLQLFVVTAALPCQIAVVIPGSAGYPLAR